LTQESIDVLQNLAELTIGAGAVFEVESDLVTLQSLETLFLGDGSSIDVSAGTSVTFVKGEDKKLATTLGKKVFYSIGVAADAVVDVAITDDASLLSGSTITVNEGSTFTVAAGKTLTVEDGAVLDFSAVKAAAGDTEASPVTISGTIKIEEGGGIAGPALADIQSDPAALFRALKVVDDGKVVLNWGAALTLGTDNTATGYSYVGEASSSSAYEWTGSTTDGAQIEINDGDLIIRDTNGGGANVTVGAPQAVILKGQSLTVDDGAILTIGENQYFVLNGGSEADGNGAIR
jgi:hypothetical protein